MPNTKDSGVTKKKGKKGRALVPAEGERRAIRGYLGQYDRAGAAIYAELERGQLLWIGVADRNAGIADDLVLGFDGLVVGHQFKTSQFPASFTVETLLTGANGLLKPLIEAWQALCNDQPTAGVEIRLVVNDYPSTNDSPGNTPPAHSAAFLEDFAEATDRSLQEWRDGRWSGVIDRLHRASGLLDDQFEHFLRALRIIHGSGADFVLAHKLSVEQARLATEIAALLPQLVGDRRNKDRWTRAELLEQLGWSDPTKVRHLHQFPIGAHVQRNRDTEAALLAAVRGTECGYIALVGPPGSGKSTLLQTALATEPKVRLVRYLAYVPGSAQGVGRGEAEDFLEDLTIQLRQTGLRGLRLKDNSLHERREQFGAILKQAGERYRVNGVRTLIVLDGLDHIPREERPLHSLLAELPLPNAIPLGVVFVLGTQRLDLACLKPAIQEHAQQGSRLVSMCPLDRVAVASMADALNLDPAISRRRLYERSHGHPLATRYLIQALLAADDSMRTLLFEGGREYGEDIDSVYASAWREISSDLQAMHALAFIARAEAPMPLALLATVVEEQAIERALLTARHLLRETTEGWSVFHNSFRLFVLSKPRMRLGAIDPTYSPSVYRELAQLASTAPASSAQRWLELRYAARAGEIHQVLGLSTPAFFRRQLGQGRGTADIEADIRLALLAARTAADATVVTRLLLCRDEVSRRSTALEYAEQLPLAMLSAGELEAACAYVRDFPAKGYEVVDALLERGDYDGAKELFEHLEPLSQLHTSRFQNYGHEHNVHEFKKWARRVFHFRDFEQIRLAIDHLEAECEPDPDPSASPADEQPDSLSVQLKLEVAQAVVSHQPGIDLGYVCDQLGMTAAPLAALMVQAGIARLARGDGTQALALFQSAANLPDFTNLPNSSLRTIALCAAISGDQPLAVRLFDRLVPPAIAMGDDELHYNSPSWLVQAVMEHAQLATLIGNPLSSAKQSRHTILRPLQDYATQVGVLLGRAHLTHDPIEAGAVQRLCRTVMGYILRLIPSAGSDFHLTHLAITASPLLASSFVKIAGACQEGEYRAVIRVIDELVAKSSVKRFSLLRREVALATYAVDGDRESAAQRLDPLVTELVENTPSEQLDGLADLVVAFAAIGDLKRARQLLAAIPEHCLGYALAAKKDPLYTVWHNVLVNANAADPEQREARTAQLMRQVEGMKETEGASAAHRLARVLIEEAMRSSTRFGYEAAQSLGEWGLIGWPNRIDALMAETLRRRPDLLHASIAVWCGLCLPYYEESHYRATRHIGDFIDVAADSAGAPLIADVVSTLQRAIELSSRAQDRLALLNRLRNGAARHGHQSLQLEIAIQRWEAEAPPARDYSTPQKYDDASSLVELEQAFLVDATKLDFHAPYRFLALADSAPVEQVVGMYERWEALQASERCRFLVVERLVHAGNAGYASRLLEEYLPGETQRRSWSQWMGGEQYHYFKARLALEGPSVRPVAFASFVDSLVTGEDSSMLLLAEIESILPIICAEPDWPAIWSLLSEQMEFTREYRLGRPFEPSQAAFDDTELLAELVYQAVRLPITDVRWNAQQCALQLAHQQGFSEQVFSRTIARLLAGELDEPWHAMQILSLVEEQSHMAGLGALVASLVNHRDLGVAVAAQQLARHWGLSVSATSAPLPLVYQLSLGDEFDDNMALTDEDTGAMLIEKPLGWTRWLRPVVAALAQATGVDEVNLRQRAATLISEWGGLNAFGQSAIKKLEVHLRTMDMQIQYLKPHAWVGIVAMRHVAGELYRAGLLAEHHLPALLEQLNTSSPPQPLVSADVRPGGILRPLLSEDVGWNEREQYWLTQVENDVGAWDVGSDVLVLAEVSQFVVIEPRQYRYRQLRVRAPGLLAPRDGFERAFHMLPALVWLGQEVVLDVDLSPSFIRRYVSSFPGQGVPAYRIALCPNWLRRLRWTVMANDPRVYLDATATVVAKVTWWRDAGPVDLNSASVWGEGSIVYLTPAGLTQLQAATGNITIGASAQREASKMGNEGQPSIKVASAVYPLH
jgi:hypothetical protein